MKTFRPSILLCAALGLCISLSHGQSPGSPLPLQRIFKKPYIAGSRPVNPKISPNGNVIFFRWDSSAQNKYRWWMTQANGSYQHMLPDTLLDEIEWSPDSKTIAYTRKGDIFLTDTSFQVTDRLTKTEEGENSLRWSPDSKLLAFSSDKSILAFSMGKPGVIELASATEKNSSLNLIDF